jgi:hypothetical protein
MSIKTMNSDYAGISVRTWYIHESRGQLAYSTVGLAGSARV